MKKTLCLLAVATTIFTPTLALAADVDIYGRAHVSLDYLDDGASYSDVGLSSNSSRIGFKAEQKLANGMTVFGQIEQQINFSSASKDTDNVDFATRDTFVGLKSDFGQIRVGRFDSPFKAARSPANFFGDQVGDLRNLTRAGDHRFDERNENSIEYKSPKFAGGFQAAAALSLHPNVKNDKDDSGDAKDNNKAYDVALTYKEGAMDVALAYEHYEENAANPRANSERSAVRLAGSYQVTDRFKLGAFYQNGTIEAADNKDAQVYGLGGNYQLTDKTALRGHVFQRDTDENEANSTLVALGLEHSLDKSVRIYANLATVLNDENSNLNPWSQARSNNITSVKGQDNTALSLGFRYDF